MMCFRTNKNLLAENSNSAAEIGKFQREIDQFKVKNTYWSLTKAKNKKECKERHTWSVSSHDGGLSLKSASSKSSNDFRLDFEEKL